MSDLSTDQKLELIEALLQHEKKETVDDPDTLFEEERNTMDDADSSMADEMDDVMDEKRLSWEEDFMGETDAFDELMEESERSVYVSQPSYGSCLLMSF